MLLDLFEQSFIQESISEFVRKLYIILESSDHQTTISWSHNGTAFEIINSKLMEQYILPAIFKQKTISSFIRQLNMYDFKKFQKGDKQKLVFMHTFFRKNQVQDLVLIRRKHRGYVQKVKSDYDQITSSIDRFNTVHKGILNRLRINLQPFENQFQKINYQLPRIALEKQKQSDVKNQHLRSFSSIPSFRTLIFQNENSKSNEDVSSVFRFCPRVVNVKNLNQSQDLLIGIPLMTSSLDLI